MNDMPTLGGEADLITGPGEGVTTITQAMRRPAPPVPHATEFVTTQTTPPATVGTIRGLIAGIAVALLTGLSAAVALLADGGTDRAAILAGLGVGLTGLIGVVSAFAAYGVADQQSTTTKV